MPLLFLCAAAPARFTTPPGWSAAHPWWGDILTAPEQDTRLAIVNIPGAASAAEAVAQAWALFGRAPGRLKLAARGAPHDGWDEAWDFSYLTPAVARADQAAMPLRLGQGWTVALLDGRDATVEKRRADVRLVLQSLRPRDYVSETFSGRAAHELDAARIAALKDFVQAGMRALGVPGASLAVVQHGRILFEGGFGVRVLGGTAPVDAHTLFLLASNTKGLTTLLLSRLVDAGKLRWDEKVVDAYPAFRLGDDATTRRVEIRHLVCACTGLPRADLEWLLHDGPATPPAQVFASLAGMRPSSAFGQTYQYSNIMAAAAGYVGGRLARPGEELGAAYDDAMRAEVLAPLGMNDTVFDFGRAQAGNFASPHGDDVEGRAAPASIDLDTPIIAARSAGGAFSSAHDMALYVRDELSLGRLPDGRQFVSPGNLLQRRAPMVNEGEHQVYGMGLRTDNTWGVPVVHHGGALPGYRSDFWVVPDADAGAVLLANASSASALLRPFARRLLEILYDGRPEAQAALDAAAAARRQTEAAERALLDVPPDAGAADKLAARYENAALGHISVVRQGRDVVFDFGAWRSHVATHRDGAGVSWMTIDPAAAGLQFTVGPDTLTARDGQHDYIYRAVK